MEPMRFLPEQSVQCHVCRSSYTLKTEYDAGTQSLKSEPRQCPWCDAPRRRVPPPTPGYAKGLLLAHGRAPSYVKKYGDAERYLERYTLSEQDVDTYLSLADGLDLEAWEQAERGVRKPTGEGREALTILPRLRADKANGILAQELGAMADRVKQRLRAEHEAHLQIFHDRRGGQ